MFDLPIVSVSYNRSTYCKQLCNIIREILQIERVSGNNHEVQGYIFIGTAKYVV